MNYKAAWARRMVAVALILLVAVSAYGAQSRPKSVILIIGDGMGIGAITAARCAGPGENGKLTLDTMPVTGLLKTHPEAKLVTDSAAAATALATGRKTENGRISVDSAGKSLPTILELADTMGKSTGVVTNDAVTGATPAAFYAHTDDRGKQDEIALQLIGSKVSVAMGGGKQYLAEKQAAGQDVAALIKSKGFDLVSDANGMTASRSKRVLGLFSFHGSGPTVEGMLDKALSMLSTNPKGFFLMAESSLPDWGGHGNDAPTVVKGVADLDKALSRAVEFATKDRNTLIVVTSDHETGGLVVLDKGEGNPQFKPGWVHKGHTGNMVALYAFGPGAEKFTGTHDNTEIPKILAALWGKRLGD